MKRASVIRASLALALVVGAALAFIFLPVKDYMARLFEWTKSAGAMGPIAVGAAYVIACVLFIPGSLLTLGAGFLFGVPLGTVAVSIGSTLGAGAAFLVGRNLAREWIEKQIQSYPRFKAIDQAVGSHGFKIVLLTRLSPLFPFNFLNFAYGVTRVRFKDYILASWIGMFPGTLMYVYLGAAAGSLAKIEAGEIQRTPAQTAFFIVGLLAAIVVSVFVSKIAKKAMAEAVPGGQAPAGDAPAKDAEKDAEKPEPVGQGSQR